MEMPAAYQVDFANPPGEPALLDPDSPHWRIYKNPIALGIGGVAAVLLEFADARIRSGVWDHSIYPRDPIGRSRRTGAVALAGVYGPASRAREIIQSVNRLHARVKGETPAGEGYKALDPELLDWVGATAAYGFVTAYDRFVEPLSEADKARYYRDGARIGKLYGAQTLLGSTDDFFEMMEKLLPRFEPHPIVEEFLGIIQSGTAAPSVPRFLHIALGRAAVSLLPEVVRDRLRLGRRYDLTMIDRIALKAAAYLAERKVDPATPQCQAALRLGLPVDFVYRPAVEQRRLMAEWRGRQQAAE
jgi:uncharacterized protein (DUF2236 family)